MQTYSFNEIKEIQMGSGYDFCMIAIHTSGSDDPALTSQGRRDS